VDDLLVEESLTALVQHTVTSSAPEYHGQLAPTVEVLVLDNDAPGIVVSPTDHTVAVGEGGSYTIALTSQPSATVQINLYPPAGVQIQGSCVSDPAVPACLTFTADNWQQPQTVSFQGQQVGSGEIEHTIVTTDPHYAQLSDPLVKVTVTGQSKPNPGGNDEHDPIDSDGDGVPDTVECPGGIDCPDSNNDGVPDYLDPDNNGGSIPTEPTCPGSTGCPGEDEEETPNPNTPGGSGQLLFLPLVGK
jgi:hypothetical protein